MATHAMTESDMESEMGKGPLIRANDLFLRDQAILITRADAAQTKEQRVLESQLALKFATLIYHLPCLKAGFVTPEDDHMLSPVGELFQAARSMMRKRQHEQAIAEGSPSDFMEDALQAKSQLNRIVYTLGKDAEEVNTLITQMDKLVNDTLAPPSTGFSFSRAY